ncbi:MAG: carboxypeptidase regulatory-like domain-containing protein [Planctomycetota bacterium]
MSAAHEQTHSPLDENLRLLLQRAYAPVLPDPAWLERAETALLAGLAPVTGLEPVPGSRSAWRRAWPPALAAALLVIAAWAASSWLASRNWDAGRTEQAPTVPESPTLADATNSVGGQAPAAESRLPIPIEHPTLPLTGTGPEAASDWDSAPGLAELRWEVVDEVSGAPLAAVRITLVVDNISQQGPEVTSRELSSEAGRYQWQSVTPNSYSVFIQAPGYAAHVTRRVVVTATELRPAQSVFMNQGGTVRGQVVRADTGEPVAGALVVSESDAPALMLALDPAYLDEAVEARAVTDSAGAFELARLASGDQVLRISAPGYAPAWSASLPLKLGGVIEDLRLLLSGPASVSGRVHYPDGSGLPGAVVIASIADGWGLRPCMSFALTVTDEAGRYHCPDLPDHGLAMLLMFQSQAAASAGERPEMKPVDLSSRPQPSVDFLLKGASVGPSLHGFVLNERNEPLPGVILSFQRSGVEAANWHIVSSDENGRYELAPVEPGEWEAYYVEGEGRTVVRLTAMSLGAGETVRHNLRLPEGQLSGRILDAATEQPVSSAVVSLEQEGLDGSLRFFGRVVVGVDGAYRFPRLSAGRYRLAAYPTAGDLAMAILPSVALPSSALLTNLNFRLPVGGRVEVSVRDSAGQPVAGARLRFFDATGAEQHFAESMQTDALGQFTALGVPVGTWAVEASAGGGAPSRSELSVLPTGRHAIEFVLHENR